jgi:hypothetical protein
MAVHPVDRFVRRETFMRADGKTRLFEKNRDRICLACITKERRPAGQEVLL